ncbi:unnamed protein product, partial [Allacma fusca]
MEGTMASCESSSDDEFVGLMATKAEHRGNDRVIVLVDVDAFEYQVRIKNKYPELEQEGRNNPIIIINQDNIILSVNYAAKLVDTINQSISFKGRYTAQTRGKLEEDIKRLSRCFGAIPSISGRFLKGIFKPEIRRTTIITNHVNILKRRLPTFKEVTSFVIRYMKRHQLQPKEIDRITLTASHLVVNPLEGKMASCESTSGDEFISVMAAKAEYRGNDRVIVFLDVDSFECQVWIKNKYPEWEQEGRSNPLIIINHDYKILSVNYAAKIVARDLMNKAELKDYEVVQTRYYTDTINQSISFKGRYTAHTRGKLEEDIERLS